MKHFLPAIALTASAVLTGSAQAAVVASWGGFEAISSNNDIINPGNVIQAINFGSDTADVDVTTSAGTVTFTSPGNTGFYNDIFFVDDNTDDGGATVTGSNSSDFHRVLDSFSDNGVATYTFTGLTDGVYYLQAFSSDDRGPRLQQLQIVTDPGGVGEEVHAEANGTLLDALFNSAYNIATITLSDGEGGFSFRENLGGASPINAIVLTQVPEPGSLALLGLGGLLIGARRRRA